MTLQDTANYIDKHSLAFSVQMTKPRFEVLAKKQYKLDDTFMFLNNLVEKHHPVELQIVPMRKNGSSYSYGVDKTITINFKNQTTNLDMDHLTQNNQIYGLGLAQQIEFSSLKDISARDKELIESLKKQVAMLEKDKALLEIKVRDLETEKATFDKHKELDLKLAKLEQSSAFDKLLENPQVLTSIISLLSANKTAGLTGAEPSEAYDPKTRFVVDFLTNQRTPEKTKDLFAILVKSQLNPATANPVFDSILETFTSYNLINPIAQ